MSEAMIDTGTALVERTRKQPSPAWCAQLHDALTRRQKELPMALVDGALALLTPGLTDAAVPGTDSAFLATVTRQLLPTATIRGVLFVDGIPDDAGMLEALPFEPHRTLIVAHRVPAVARRLAERLASWNVARAAHGFAANASNDLLTPMVMPRPALVVLPANVLGTRSTVDTVRMLRVVRSLLRPADRVLMAVDLPQGASTLEASFSDPDGRWALAHRHLVAGVAGVLEDTFDADNLAFEVRFDRANARMEGHLVARKAMMLRLPDGTIVPIGRRESLRTTVSACLDRKRLEGTLRGCALEVRAWVEGGTSAVALVEPVTT